MQIYLPFWQRKPKARFFFLGVFLLLFGLTPATGQLQIEITEIFPGQSGTDLTADWFEIQNTGTLPWTADENGDLFYDDESAEPLDAAPILGISDLQPGEYAIVLVSDDPAQLPNFAITWSSVTNLAGIKIGFVDGSGLGSSGDAVTLWLGDPNTTAPFATASYPDTEGNDGRSYDTRLMAFSQVGNASGAVETITQGGDNADVPNVASPGNRGPLTQNLNAPSLIVDSINLSPYLRYNSQRQIVVGAELGDPTDPMATIGIPLLLSDGDTPLDQITLNTISSNTNVAGPSDILLSGSDNTYNLRVAPSGVGLTDITITATDPTGNVGIFTLRYAASDALSGTLTPRFHYGASDGSTAIAVDSQYMWVADDEDQMLRLYDRRNSGMPIRQINISQALGSTTEIDIEGSIRSGNALYWMGSHTNISRSVLFRTLESGSGATSDLTYTGFYNGLRDDLIAWDENNGHGLGADFLGLSTGFEIEGLAEDPNNPEGAWLGFRGPLIDGDALLVPVTNFQTLTEPDAVPANAVFGTPILLDLEGHSIRSMACNDNGCLIVAGPAGTVTDFRLFTWSGNPQDEPELRGADLTEVADVSSIEGIVALPEGPFLGNAGATATLQLLIDTGTFDYYNNGSEAKDLPNNAWKKFRSDFVTLGPVVIPAIANPGDVVITEIMQNPSAVSDSNGEWFELYNTTAGSIDLNGWRVADADNDTIIIQQDQPLLIGAGEYLVLGNNADQNTNGGVPVNYAFNGNALTLSNGTDELILIAPDSVVVDSVGWDDGITFPDPTGASLSLQAPNLENSDGDNWCVAMTPYGDGDLGTPGSENDCINTTSPDLQITELWAGQEGTDLTADWIEITNVGQVAWVNGVNRDLYYDDESQDPAAADLINGINDIQPGESVLVVIDGQTAVQPFIDVWSTVYDLEGVEVGWADGSGLGQGGDAATLFLGAPTINNIIDYETYPAPPSGVSWDVVLQDFSMQGVGIDSLGTGIAVATLAQGGSDGMEPAIGSPGNKGPLEDASFELIITEIHPGQDGDDLTEDWFEIRNVGTAPWIAGSDLDLFYDDESADPADAVPVQGLTDLVPGETAIVLLTADTADLITFFNVWGSVIDLSGVEVGFADGSGLGSGGDAVTLWLGDPATTTPIDTASYPDTEGFDGQSWDVELQAFSEVGNANGAVATVALGGDLMTVPNIGSPGDGLVVAPETGLVITEIFSGQAGDDLTEDWFEITNIGTQSWVSGQDDPLFYDDESADPIDAVPVQGISEIQPGASVVVLLTNNPADVATFQSIWGEVIDLNGVAIGFADGSGLGGGGDAVTLWLGDPATTTPIDTASYPETDGFDGQSWDVELQAFSEVGNANGAVATIALGGDLMTVPNIGSPGNGPAIPSFTGIAITEIFPGQSGDDLTEDWFEITNIGTETWTAGTDPDLFYDDESADPIDAVPVQGLNRLAPGETAIILLTADTADVATFRSVWSEVIDLTGIAVGFADGSGLGGGGDAVTLWLGDPATTTPIDTASYPETDGFDGQSWDVELQAFSEVGNANGAVATIALGGDLMTVPNIGSPGNGPAIPSFTGIAITEIFPGQSGDDLTEDWFEITNIGTETWTAGTDPDLFYDDESADPIDAVPVQGLNRLAPGETAIILLTADTADVATFRSVWSEVIDLTGIAVGYADGSGLGGGGDAVTLWLGDPTATTPIDTASYPETDGFDGQSWDVELQAFSEVGNANGAVATLALGGDMMNVPNVGSPGNGAALPQFNGLMVTEIFPGQSGEDLTEDWFEITNIGTENWTAGTDPDLFYDDESADPADAVPIQGISSIAPGESVIILISGDTADITTFRRIWGEVFILEGVQIGLANGSGLGSSGDAVTLWVGQPSTTLPADTAAYPDTEGFDGQSYDVDLMAFSEISNANSAVATLALGGDMMNVPNIGSPGNLGPVTSTRNPANAYVFTVFPNPTTNLVTLDLPREATLNWIRVLNSQGQILQQQPVVNQMRQQINLNTLPAGLYYIQIQGTDGTAVRRIMKQ